MVYIALLRGINVGGHRVKMERLRALFCELGFENVRTFIQSGNVFFETEETDRDALTQRIETHLATALGHEVPTFLRTCDELQTLLDAKPFDAIEVTPAMRLLIVFTRHQVSRSSVLPLVSPDGSMEIIAVADKEIFVVYRMRDNRPPDVAAFLRRNLQIKTDATTRFHDTTGKMLTAAQST